MKKILHHLFEHRKLTRSASREVLHRLTAGDFNEAQMAAFMTVFLMRPIALEELQGFREALLELCQSVDLGSADIIDLCGTGGDGKNTFNISTLASFVVAGAGYPVAKHGNYGVSSGCGSSNVLEALGYHFTDSESQLKLELSSASITFMHAPLFHPALKTVGPIRKQLGVKTFFNMLGPLVNPARPRKQLAGVFSMELSRLYTYLLQESGSEFCVVHSLDGYDEVSLTGTVQLSQPRGSALRQPVDMGLPKLAQSDLHGGETVAEAADIFREVIAGEGPAHRHDVVLANAALAIGCYHPGRKFKANLEEARQSLQQGKAKTALDTLIAVSQQKKVGHDGQIA